MGTFASTRLEGIFDRNHSILALLPNIPEIGQRRELFPPLLNPIAVCYIYQLLTSVSQA